jgi:hypothetical protein
MAAKKRGAKRTKRAVKPAKRKVAAKAARPAKGAAKRKAPASRTAKPKRAPARRAAKGAKPDKAAPQNPPAPVTAATLHVVELEPLRAEASAAFARGETVLLKTGTNEEGSRVETLVFAPSWKAAQSSGTFVHRGDWSGERLVTDRGHLLDLDGNCFCRDCEAAGGYTVDDDE